ncbi:1-acyl-sn-glycerol-3-phosphate acyltransferases [Tenacibaculum sp. 190524A02b]|uniref:1-acyl-sn-glycerol-3-phosphate acyltransferases n=1 Tax=Tenacibaculum vairaonense TaxID=3137860 RepID=A0ABM9PHM1_9FLAO
MRSIIYSLFKVFIRIGLFFYSKKIIVKGTENIPKKGAVLFMANHPNGLIDPILIATHIKRKTHFLVRAAVFKNRIVAYFFDLLGMMPIYRIRDGVKQLSKNQAIFDKCESILKNNKTLLIFPEGSHNRKRTIRPLSKGFTRIIFQTLENNPQTVIHIVPIGITYQNASAYPAKIALSFGTSITTDSYFKNSNKTEVVNFLKNEVTKQLENLTVHIDDDDNYENTLSLLNKQNVDFTDVVYTNKLIEQKSIKSSNSKVKNERFKPLLYLLIVNSFIPYTIWKLLSKKVDEVEFIDTFRFSFNIILFPFFYTVQSFLMYLAFNWDTAVLYFTFSILLVLLYTKVSATPTE